MDLKLRWVDSALAGMERMAETRANLWAAFVADLGSTVLLVALSVSLRGMHPLTAALTFAGGLLLFSLVEYCFHRWLFHGPEHAMERGHRRHHQWPTGIGTLPFFLPPVCLMLLAGIFDSVISLNYALLLTGAIACGYFVYGQCHASIHGRRYRHSWLRRWAAHHHIHHHHPNRNYGVTTPLWDIVFGTRHVSRSASAMKRGARR